VAPGMDTRAFRLPLPSDTAVFELDEGPVLAEKQAVLDDERAKPICRRIQVPVNLTEDSWPDTLIGAGFDISKPAIFIVEGLSWYLSEHENAHVLDHLADLAIMASRLGIDMVHHDYLENLAMAPFFELAATRGVYCKFGTNDRGVPCRSWLARRGEPVRRGGETVRSLAPARNLGGRRRACCRG